MTTVRWWFLLGVALSLAGAAGARELARQCDAADRWLAAAFWWGVMYADVLAAAANAWLAWLGDEDDEPKGEK